LQCLLGPQATQIQILVQLELSARTSLYFMHFAWPSDGISIGLSISAPGGEAHGLDTEAFYEFLKSRGSGIITVPADRWNAEAFHGTAPGKICTVSPYSVPLPSYELTRCTQTKGGFIPDFSYADLQEFGITPAEGSQIAFSQFVL
jgi:hypothetical protein